MSDFVVPDTKMLGDLQSDCEVALGMAYDAKADIDGAINWADLHCTEAGYYRNNYGDDGLYVVIEECDPLQDQLKEFLTKELIDAGWEGVELRFEW